MTTDDRPRGRYFSISAVDEYLECPQFYYHRRVKRSPYEERQVPVHWRTGTAVHAALEAAYKAARLTQSKSATTVPCPTCHVPVDVACTGLVRCPARSELALTMYPFEPVARKALWDSWRELELPWGDGLKDWALDATQKALADLPHPGLDAILVCEEEVLTVSEDGTIMHGYPDLVLKVDDHTVKVRDWKIGSTKETIDEIARKPQLLYYAWIMRRLYPWIDRVLIEDYYPPIPAGVSIESEPDAQEEIVARVEMVAEMVENDTTWEPKPGPRCENCQFRHLCPAWNQPAAKEAARELDGF